MVIERAKGAWGLTVPGRPPTPSDGCSLIYARVGPEDSQRIRTFDNGTCITFGPEDLVDEFEPRHPFADQVAMIDRAVRDLQAVTQRNPNNDPNDENQAYLGFRSGQTIDYSQVGAVRVGNPSDFTWMYNQVPSRLASVGNLLSHHAVNNRTEVRGTAHPGDADTRFGILGGRSEARSRQKESGRPQEVGQRRSRAQRPAHNHAPAARHSTRGGRHRYAPSVASYQSSQQEQHLPQQQIHYGSETSQPSYGHQYSLPLQNLQNPQLSRGHDSPQNYQAQMLQDSSGNGFHLARQHYQGQLMREQGHGYDVASRNYQGQTLDRSREVRQGTTSQMMYQQARTNTDVQSTGSYDTRAHTYTNPDGASPGQFLGVAHAPREFSNTYTQRSIDGQAMNYENQGFPRATVKLPPRDERYAHRHRGTARQANNLYGAFLDELNADPSTVGGLLRGDLAAAGGMAAAVRPPTPVDDQQYGYGYEERPDVIYAGHYVSSSRRLVRTETETEEQEHRGRQHRSEHRRTQAISAIGAEVMESRRSSPGLAVRGRGFGPGGYGAGGRSSSAGQL